MTSLVEKARLAVLGNMHKYLDKVANTPEAYKQRIRDLESALADLRAAKDESVGTGTGYKRDITNLKSELVKKQGDIDLLLGDNDPTNDEAAVQLQLQLDSDKQRLVTLQELLAQAQNDTATLDGAIDKLESKHREMVDGFSRLTLTAAASKARNNASTAAEAAQKATDAAADGSIDSIKGQIDHQNDVATARFDRVFGDLSSSSTPEEAAKLASAKAAIEARRAVIAEQAKAPEPVATS